MRWSQGQPDAVCPSLSHFASLPSMHAMNLSANEMWRFVFFFFKLYGNIKYIILLLGSYKNKFMILKQYIFVDRVLSKEKNISILSIQGHQTKMLELCLVPAPTTLVNVI